MRKVSENEFWVTNISNKNVSLPDLAFTFPARRSVNLLNNHFSFTKEQLETSLKAGSLSKRSDVLKIRKITPPEKSAYYIQKEESKEARFTTQMPLRNMLVIENPKFDELGTSTVDFINEITDD